MTDPATFALACVLAVLVGGVGAYLATRTPGAPMPSDRQREALDAARQTLSAEIRAALEDGALEPAEVAAIIDRTLAEVIDALVPTGALDAHDDAAILAGVTKVRQAVERGLSALGKALRRDPAKMRRRADEAEADGDHERAAAIRARAAKVEARQAARG